MAAIITAEMKKRFIDEFKADADSASVRYYIGISRSEDWNDSDTAPDSGEYRKRTAFI